MKAFPYQFTVAWSADNNAFEARVPALRYCLAYGTTPEQAIKEVKIAAAAMLKVMKADGKPLPAVDATLDRVKALQPLLNLSAIASASGISVQTLSSKISRGTALTPDESSRIGRVFISHGIEARGAAALAGSVLSQSKVSTKAASKAGTKLGGTIIATQSGARSLEARVLTRPSKANVAGKVVAKKL